MCVCMKNVTGKSSSQYAICKDSNGIFSANPNKTKKITAHTLHFKVLKHIRIRIILITSEYVYVHTHIHTYIYTHTHKHIHTQHIHTHTYTYIHIHTHTLFIYPNGFSTFPNEDIQSPLACLFCLIVFKCKLACI